MKSADLDGNSQWKRGKQSQREPLFISVCEVCSGE